MRLRQTAVASLVILSVALADAAVWAQVVGASDAAARPTAQVPTRWADGPALVERMTALEEELQCVQEELESLGKGSRETAPKFDDGDDWSDDGDDYPTFEVGGVLNFDMAFFGQDATNFNTVGDIQDGVEIRRAGLHVHGEVSKVIEYHFAFDIAGAVDEGLNNGRTRGEVVFSTNYLQVHDLPYLGHVRVGHLTEPFSLERLTSSRYIPFMERGLVCALTPGKNLGAMVYNHTEGERLAWQLGCFRTHFSSRYGVGTGDEGGWSFTGRATCLPWYDEASDGRGLFHLGAAVSYRDPEDDGFRFRRRPEADLAPYFVNTDVIDDASGLTLLGAEMACAYGPFLLQSEFIQTFVARSGGPDLEYHGVYVYASWFLTGEHRSYYTTWGKFGRAEPFVEFFRVRTENSRIVTGKGAWELAARWSYLDLNDGDVLGGRLSDTTLGITGI